MARKKTKKAKKPSTVFCSFCAKEKGDVRKLLRGPGVSICDACVLLCNDIILDDLPAWPKPVGDGLAMRLWNALTSSLAGKALAHAVVGTTTWAKLPTGVRTEVRRCAVRFSGRAIQAKARNR